ncbi:hypothetical protein Tco_0270777 [Tanacetum coccineum]
MSVQCLHSNSSRFILLDSSIVNVLSTADIEIMDQHSCVVTSESSKPTACYVSLCGLVAVIAYELSPLDTQRQVPSCALGVVYCQELRPPALLFISCCFVDREVRGWAVDLSESGVSSDGSLVGLNEPCRSAPFSSSFKSLAMMTGQLIVAFQKCVFKMGWQFLEFNLGRGGGGSVHCSKLPSLDSRMSPQDHDKLDQTLDEVGSSS